MKQAEGSLPVHMYNQLRPPASCRLALVQVADAAAAANPAPKPPVPPAAASLEVAARPAGTPEAAHQTGPPAPAAARPEAAPAGKAASSDHQPHDVPSDSEPVAAFQQPLAGCLETWAAMVAGQQKVGCKRPLDADEARTSSVDAELQSQIGHWMAVANGKLGDQLLWGPTPEQLLAAEAAWTDFGGFFQLDPMPCGLQPTTTAPASPLPPAGVPPLPLSPARAASVAPLPPISTQHVMPQGSPALHPGLWSIGPFAGAALPAVAGAQPGMPPCSPASSVPAAALAPSSFDAALAAAALAPGSMFASLSAATAGNSFPDWQAGAPVLGSGWAPAPAGELLASGRLDAGALAGWPNGVMPQCAAQPAGGSGAPGSHPHCPAASCPAFPDPPSAAAGHQPASPAADVQPVGGPPAMGQQSALLASTQALEQLLDLSSTPARNNVLAPLQSQGGQRWRLGGEGQRCGWRAGRQGREDAETHHCLLSGCEHSS